MDSMIGPHAGAPRWIFSGGYVSNGRFHLMGHPNTADAAVDYLNALEAEASALRAEVERLSKVADNWHASWDDAVANILQLEIEIENLRYELIEEYPDATGP
jgi:hypothetical protein